MFVDLHSATGKKGPLMVSLLSQSVHKFRAGVAIRKDTWRGKPTAGNDSFQHELSLLLYDEKLSLLRPTTRKFHRSFTD
jgi:hypothetical protein